MEKLAVPANYSIQISAGTPENPSEIESTDVRTERTGFFAGIRRAFGKKIKTQLKISTRTFANLLEAKKVRGSSLNMLRRNTSNCSRAIA